MKSKTKNSWAAYDLKSRLRKWSILNHLKCRLGKWFIENVDRDNGLSYVKTGLNSLVRDDLIPHGLEAICVQIKRPKSKPLLIATCYRPPNSPPDIIEKN